MGLKNKQEFSGRQTIIRALKRHKLSVTGIERIKRKKYF